MAKRIATTSVSVLVSGESGTGKELISYLVHQNSKRSQGPYIKVNCAAYISKYLRKMKGWSDLHLALLWSGKSRMYSFSRGFSAKAEKKEAEWQRWRVIETSNRKAMEKSLEEGGYKVEHNERKEGRA